jgi:hypothetical protein
VHLGFGWRLSIQALFSGAVDLALRVKNKFEDEACLCDRPIITVTFLTIFWKAHCGCFRSKNNIVAE